MDGKKPLAPRESRRGIPFSRLTRAAVSLARACSDVAIARITSARWAPDVAPHGPRSASAAALTAAPTSAVPANAALPSTSLVAASSTSLVLVGADAGNQ